MKFYLIIITTLLCITVNGQNHNTAQICYPDSGVTKKTEAKNLTVNGLKEGEWIEYYNLETKTLNSNPYKTTVHVPTADTNAMYYDLGICKAGKLNGVVRYYENKSNKYMFYHYFINGQIIAKR